MAYRKRVHETPRLLVADAYTIGSNLFQSDEAKDKSTYYITFRRELYKINPTLYKQGDNRIVFVGLQRIIDRLFSKPITHQEIDETKEFLKNAKVTSKGFKNYNFPEQLWREVVDKYNGYPPIQILAMPEGSIVYPNEPVIQIRSLVEGFGELAAWFESKLLQVYGATERATQDRHWFLRLMDMVRMVDPTLDDKMVMFYASIMLTDFGDRAGLCAMESEDLGTTALYTFGGTDTFCGAYQAWKNGATEPGFFSSVLALAHRNVQAFEFEGDCYTHFYESVEDGEFLSMVADCYDFFYAVEHYLLPLALRSVRENNGKVIVGRPDSGDPKAQVLWLCRLAVKHGLYTTQVINGKEWKFATTLRFIEGDGMDYETMWDIMMALIEEGFAPYGWGLFGMGGGQRNDLKRDNLSAKYALCARGLTDIPVVKFSETYGKTTLPGPFKVLRSKEALEACKTIVFEKEAGINAMIEFFNGLKAIDKQINDPFGVGMEDDFPVIKNRMDDQFTFMPKTLHTETNHGYPASDEMIETRRQLLKKYAPSKHEADY